MAGIKLYSSMRPGPTAHVGSSLSPFSTTTIVSSASMSARSVRSSRTSTSQNKLRKPQPRVKVPEPVHWLFRTNIPRRRQSYIPASPGRRNFFGMGEIVGVLSNPASTVRSLTESRRLLEEARREIQETRERSQIRPTHTFSRLPGYYPRRIEQQVIRRSLEGEPSFTLLFGPPSAGKTALLREILSHPRYHVLHFDLRIAGFADLESLYMSLSTQMEGFFEELANKSGWYEAGSSKPIELSADEVKDEGWDSFEREAWGFKHDRINLQKRLDGEGASGPKGEVRPSDIARLMELFQSSLLRYREFDPSSGKRKLKPRQYSEDTTVVGSQQALGGKKRWFSKGKSSAEKIPEPPLRHSPPSDEAERKRSWKKRVPVVFFDEAHKLPHLIPSPQTMQAILDSTLVLTKQDRLCHVVHATSDPFYQGWLSRVGVLWYCKLIAIGDLSKSEMRGYYQERVVPRLTSLPAHVKRLDFETLYDAFGGKVAHWADFITDHVNSGGMIGIKQSSHFLQAHSLLNLHIIHSSQAPGGGFDGSPGGANTTAGSLHGEATANMSTEAHRASPEAVLHPHLGPASFRMYQAGMGQPIQSTPSTLGLNPLISSFTPYEGVGAKPDFSPMQLLKVMSRFTTGGLTYLPYFHLCRELGAKAVDAMIRGRVVDVKFTDSLPNLINADPSRGSTGNTPVTPRANGFHAQDPTLVQEPSAVEFGHNPPPLPHQNQPPPPFSEEDESMVPVSDEELLRRQQQQHQPVHTYTTQATHASSIAPSFNATRHYGAQVMDEGYHDDEMEMMEDEELEYEEEVIGPKIVPVSPIMRYAMREVIKEYQDDQSVSEYASLSDVEEY